MSLGRWPPSAVSMALPSPVRAITGYVVLFVLLAGVFGMAILGREGPGAALAVGAVTILLGVGTALISSLRVRRVLGEFAAQVPGEPTPDQSRWNDQSLTWEEPPLTVHGSTSGRGFRLRKLRIDVGDRTRYRSPFRAREAAREAMVDLDRRPAVGSAAARLPSPDPLHAAFRAGGLSLLFVPWFVLVFAIGPLGIGRAVEAWVAGACVALLVGAFRWSTLQRIRAGFPTFEDGLHTAGVRLQWVDFQGGLLRPRYRVHTDAGDATLVADGHPWGTVTPVVDDLQGCRLVDLSDCGRALGEILRSTDDSAAAG